MGLQTYLLRKDPATLSPSEKIEFDYVNRLISAVKGSSIATVNAIMTERSNNLGLRKALVAEKMDYELRKTFAFKNEDEVRL